MEESAIMCPNGAGGGPEPQWGLRPNPRLQVVVLVLVVVVVWQNTGPSTIDRRSGVCKFIIAYAHATKIRPGSPFLGKNRIWGWEGLPVFF